MTRSGGSDTSAQTSQSLSAGAIDAYAHVEGAGLHAQKPGAKASMVAGGDPSKESTVSRNAFKDLIEANAAALAPRAAEVADADGSSAPSAPARWSVSIDGGRVQLAATAAGQGLRDQRQR